MDDSMGVDLREENIKDILTNWRRRDTPPNNLNSRAVEVR